MVDKLPLISQVHFEQTPERLKIVLPARRSWAYLTLYSVMMLIWLIMIIGGSVYLVQTLFSGQSYRFVFAIMIFILLAILVGFGRFVGRQWSQYLSNREILFINQEELIVRRPVSIWGNTDVYDLEHVSPVYVTDAPETLAFDYGYRHIYFGGGITAEARQALQQFLNRTYLPAKG